MNYEKIYEGLINKARLRGWSKKTAPWYCESHHILPKSMGGDNSKANKVVLSGREHLVAHKLLYRIHRNQKMTFALWQMLQDTRNGRTGMQLSSREFENLRAEVSKQSSIVSSLKEPFRHTEQSKRLLSEAHLGKVLSDETRDRMSKARIGNVCQSKGMYFTPNGSGRSLLELAELNSCSTTTIQSRCKLANTNTIVSKKNKEFIGKTWRELGWAFVKTPSKACILDIPETFEKRITDYSHRKLEGVVDYNKYQTLLS